MSNDLAKPISDEEVVALAKTFIESSREDINQRAVAETPGAGRELPQQQPGITIDLGHKNIARLPDDVIDVMRTEIERLALSHNLLTTLPLRLTECLRLRYLNVRYNSLREIPEAVLRMTSLEILDVSKNKIKVIPPEIANLTSLKVLAIQKNKIEELPVCLGDINSLLVLKLDGNPIRFPPPEVCTIKGNTPSPALENERDAVIATQVKKYMRQHASKEKQKVETEKLRIESEGDESESNVETPRPRVGLRMASGRFPVKPSISNLDGFGETRPESPGMPPPIPTRSHYRVQSQQNNGTVRRPQISPLMLTNLSNERNRSHSEGAGSATIRAKRMGFYTNKTSELGPVDELRRSSHFRGFSQGYTAPTNGVSNGMSGPPTGYSDHGTQRPTIHRPLSDVREHKRGSRAPDLVVEAGKNIVYAILQLRDPVSYIMQSVKRSDRTKAGLRKKEEFPRRVLATYEQVRNLNDLLRQFDTLAEEDEEDAHKLSQAIHQACLRCLGQFMLVTVLIHENAAEIARACNPRFLRSYLLLQQGSMIELRNACSSMGAEFKDSAAARRQIPLEAEPLSTARPPRPLKTRRYQASPPQRAAHHPVPPPVMLNSGESTRTNTLTSISAATPRSGESFGTLSTAMSRSNTMQSNLDELDEDAQFDRIYAKLRGACDICSQNMPQIARALKETFEVLKREPDSNDEKLRILGGLIDKSDQVESIIKPLHRRLSTLQLKDPFARSHPDFWQQWMGFAKAWANLAVLTMAEARSLGVLSTEVKALMKPVHKEVKEASMFISDSPWSHLTGNSGSMGPPSAAPSMTSRTQPPRFPNHRPPHSGMNGSVGFPTPLNTSISSVASQFGHPYSTASLHSLSSTSSSFGFITPVPATPLSAALGAAAQATVPNTPSQIPSATNSYFGGNSNTGPFAGNVFERADRLLSNTARRV